MIAISSMPAQYRAATTGRSGAGGFDQVVVVIRARRKAAGALFPEGLTIHTPDFTRFARSRELRVAQPLQAQVHGAREVAVVEAADEPQPGGDAFEQQRTLFDRQFGGRGHDNFELTIG